VHVVSQRARVLRLRRTEQSTRELTWLLCCLPLSERSRHPVPNGLFEALKDELGKLKYPIYLADFETVNPALPRFAGMRPYDQIPFQWSVHVQRQPGAAPVAPTH
jgi:hypothetical protein